MTKTAPAKPAAAPQVEVATEVPTLDPLFTGAFAPWSNGVPFTFDDLVALLRASGMLNSGPFSARDQQGAFVDANGQVVMPAEFARFYQPVPVQPTNA